MIGVALSIIAAALGMLVPAMNASGFQLRLTSEEWAGLLATITLFVLGFFELVRMIRFPFAAGRPQSAPAIWKSVGRFAPHRQDQEPDDESMVGNALPVALFYADSHGDYVYTNPAYQRLTGCDAGRLLGAGWHCTLHPEDRERVIREWMIAVRTTQHYRSVHRLIGHDGNTLWVSVKAAPVIDGGRLSRYAGAADEITSMYDELHSLREGSRLLRTVTDNLPALIAYVDKEERYCFCNRQYQDLFGQEGKPLAGSRVREVLGDKLYSHAREKIRRVLDGERVSYERLGKELGTDRCWRVDYIPDVAEDGSVGGFYVMILDITQLKLVEHQLSMLARFDSLTGLANRNQFNEKLEEAIARSNRSNLQLALMFLDIDHFKQINDSLGHQAGDEVLKEFGRRLQGSVRQTDTVARLAGDEFVIILDGLHQAEEASRVASKIIDAMAKEFVIAGCQWRVTTSIGIAIRREQDDDADALLCRADKALYFAKSAGRNTYEIIM